MAAFSEVVDYLRAQSDPAASALILEKSPNADSKLADATVQDLMQGYKFWQTFTPNSAKVHIVFAQRQDIDWFVERMKAAQPGNGEWIPRIYDLAKNNPGNAYGGSNGGDSQGVPLFFFLPGSVTQPNSPGWLGTGPHEWTHQAQYIMTGNINLLPCWFKEGQATFFGNAISNDEKAKWQSVWKFQLNTIRYDLPSFYTMTTGDLKIWFTNHTLNMPNNVCGPDGAFMIGGMATEYLTGTLGLPAIFKFEELIKTGMSWDAALEKVSGKSADILIDEIIQFVLYQRSWMQS